MLSKAFVSSLQFQGNIDNIEVTSTSGEILQDRSSTGRERPWRKRKRESEYLAESYERLGKREKAERCACCGCFLRFEVCPSGHYKRLAGAHFCKDRLCPMCAWRRSLMLSMQIRKVAHVANEREKLRWLFLTLTVRNVEGDSLSSMIDELFASWKRLANRKVFKEKVVGWFRALEVTRNSDRNSGSFDTYHPHFHVLLAVRPSYFSRGYVTHNDWTSLWKSALGVDYTPIVDIRRVKPKDKPMEFMDDEFDVQGDELRVKSLESAVVETAKYPVKPVSYLIKGNEEETDRAVEVLDGALAHRRLLGYGGLLKTIWNELKAAGEVSDVEADNADLVHVDNAPESCTCPTCNSDLMETVYQWQRGFKNYVSL